MKRELIAGAIALVLIFGLVGVVSTSTEFIDTAQYNADIEDLWSFEHIIDPNPTICSGSTDWYYTTYPSVYYKSVYLYGTVTSDECVCIGKCYLYARMKSSHQSKYFSFDMRDMDGDFYVGGHSSVTVYLVTYNSDGDITNRYVIGSISGSGPGGSDYVYTYQNNHLFEFNVESNQMYILIDGDSKGSLGSYSELKSPYYWGIELYVYAGMSCGAPEYDSWASMKMWFDDVTTGDGIVGIGHEANPSHTITELSSFDLDTSWHIKTVPSTDYTSGQYDLKVKRATWGEWYNVTTLKEAGNSSAKPSGFIVYNWSTLFNTDNYGLYWFSIYKTDEGETTKIADDWLFFRDIGEDSYINIEETEYAIGTAMNVSYYIGEPDFGANDYWIYMYDSSGSKVDELELFEQAATHEFTSTIDWEVGTCYAVLVEDTQPSIDVDPPTDIIDLAYDFTWLTDAIYIRGYTWDASNPDNLVDGTKLTNVNVNFTHNNDEYNATSDGSGFYEFISPLTSEEMEFYMDIPIHVNASKTGYTHDNFTTEIIRAGTYYIDLYLVPSERDVNQDNSSIAGLVLDLPFHQAIPYATVHIENTTWSNTTTTNTWGYYIFDYKYMNNSVGLGDNTYTMWATKETFSGSAKEEVLAHDAVYTLDNCDVVDFYEVILDECDSLTNNGNWISNNSLSLNNTDYMESTGSLQTIGNQTIDYMKTFTSAVDSNVSKEHGLFYFYSRILDKAQISSTNVTIIIGSNSTNSSDTITFKINKDYFESDFWNLTILPLVEGEESGSCNLSAINYFELKSTKSGNVTTKIDELKFIMWSGWDSNCLNLSADTVNKKEGVASVYGQGSVSGYKSDGFLAKYFMYPLDTSSVSKTGKLSRMEFWEKPEKTNLDYVLVSKKEAYNYTEDWGNVSGDKYGFLFWDDVSVSTSWNLRKLYLTDAYESNFTTSSLEWFEIIMGGAHYTSNYERWIDKIQLKEVGRTYHNFYMDEYYDLTVHAKEMESHNTITDFKAIWDSTNVKETTNGTVIFSQITYGIYALEVTADGFYTSKQYIFMGQDTEETVYLLKIGDIAEGGVGQYYPPPHLVEFRVQNMYGSPITDLTVTAQGYETTMGSWDWMYSIFGYKNETQIHNTTMNGTTDSMGHLSFLMVETIKYKIDFEKESEGINKTMYFYPKEQQYTIILTPTAQPMIIDYVGWNLSVEEISGDNGNRTLNFTYTDTMNKTTKACFFIKDENRTEIYSTCNFPDNSSIDTGYKVAKTSGATYFWGFNCTHETFGEIKGTKAVTFKSRLIDLQLENENYYSWISIALLVMITSLFSAVTTKFGYIVLPFIAGFFTYIQWLEIPTTLITIIIILGVLLYAGKRERETGL